MKIIFNKTLRDINDTLNRRNIIVPDYMISRELLKVISNSTDGISLLSKLSGHKDKISEEQYYLILKIYEKNKDVVTRLIDRIGYFSFKDLEYIYNNKPDLLLLFINNTNLLTKKNIEEIGLNFLVSNIEYFKNIDLERIRPYLSQIKQYPKNLELFIKYIDRPDIFEFISNKLDKSNLNDIVFVLENVKDITLREYVKNNLGDVNVINLAKAIISNKITIPKLSIVNCLDYIKEIKGVLPELDDKDIESLIVFQLKDLEDKNETMNCFEIMYKMLLNIEDVKMVKSTIDEALKNNVELNSECQKVLEAYKLLDSKLPVEEIFKNFKIHYNLKDLSLDYDSIYEWTKKYKAGLISQNLVNIDNLSTVRNIEYTDDVGIVHQIPIKVIDDPNFEVFVHSVPEKEDNNLNKVTNWQIANQLFDNPNLWQDNTMQGNPHISMSYFTGDFKPFGGKKLVLGFNICDSDRLIATFRGDAATDMKKDMETMFSESKSMYFEDHESLKKYRDYNEILLHRYKDGSPPLPSYIVLDGDSLANMDIAKKWAAYYNIPIVIIDKEKIGEKRKNDLNSFLSTVGAHRTLTPEIKEELIKRLKDTNWCYEHNRENMIDPFDVLDYLMHSIEFNHENIKEMLDLLSKYHYASFNPHSNEPGEQIRALDLENFIPEKYKGTASINEQEVINLAKKREQQVSEYLLQCKNYLSHEFSNQKSNFNR